MHGGVSGRPARVGECRVRGHSVAPTPRPTAPAATTLGGELALAVPNPNTRGDGYLDDFEATDELPSSDQRRFWIPGSRPESLDFATAELPLTLDANPATGLVWQHDVLD